MTNAFTHELRLTGFLLAAAGARVTLLAVAGRPWAIRSLIPLSRAANVAVVMLAIVLVGGQQRTLERIGRAVRDAPERPGGELARHVAGAEAEERALRPALFAVMMASLALHWASHRLKPAGRGTAA